MAANEDALLIWAESQPDLIDFRAERQPDNRLLLRYQRKRADGPENPDWGWLGYRRAYLESATPVDRAVRCVVTLDMSRQLGGVPGCRRARRASNSEGPARGCSCGRGGRPARRGLVAPVALRFRGDGRVHRWWRMGSALSASGRGREKPTGWHPSEDERLASVTCGRNGCVCRTGCGGIGLSWLCLWAFPGVWLLALRRLDFGRAVRGPSWQSPPLGRLRGDRPHSGLALSPYRVPVAVDGVATVFGWLRFCTGRADYRPLPPVTARKPARGAPGRRGWRTWAPSPGGGCWCG
jgi:hypothetical protein